MVDNQDLRCVILSHQSCTIFAESLCTWRLHPGRYLINADGKGNMADPGVAADLVPGECMVDDGTGCCSPLTDEVEDDVF